MSRPPSIGEDVRFALRLAALGFDREAARILEDHKGDAVAAFALKTIAGMTPGDARQALDSLVVSH